MGFKTDYKDDIINTTSNEKRQYEMIQNDNGTVSFNDVTVYEQVGDTLGAKELNEISEKLNISGERIRYNNVTDMVQILNDDGLWEDWSSGSTAVALLKNGIITTTYYSDSLEISTEYSGFSYFYPTSKSNYVVFNNDLKSYFGKYIKIVAKSDTSGATVKVSEKFQTSITSGTIDIVTLSLEEYEKSFYVPVQYIENCNVAELELQFGLGSGAYIKTIEITASDGTEGGGGSDDVELTQAEYDALPDTKLTDNKNYFIKDATENNGNLVRNGKSYTGGGVDIEAEVIDIRLKADGTTATSAGNAVREQVSELKSDLVNHIGKNMCGMNPNVFYPVLLKTGDIITMSTSDGSVNDKTTNLRFYDKNKNLVLEKSFISGISQRTVTINDNIPEIRYINWAYQFGKVYQVEKGSNATGFEEYNDMLDLNSALKKSACGYFTLDLFFNFINAGLTNGQLTDRCYRASSKNKVLFENDVYIEISNGYKMAYQIIENSEMILDSGWITGNCILPKNKSIMLTISKVSEDVENVINIDEYVNKITAKFIYDNILVVPQMKIGSMSNGSFVRQDDIPRVVIMDYLAIDNVYTIGNPSDTNFLYNINCYDGNLNYIGSTDWTNHIGKNTILNSKKDTAYIRLIMKKQNGTISENDYENVVIHGNESTIKKIIKPSINSTLCESTKCKTICHTGMLTDNYPRNSYEGFLEACKSNVWGIETDLQVTSDGIIVCLHDAYHGRLTSGSGVVSEMTFDEQYENNMLSFDYVGTPSQYRICKFDDFLRLCKIYGKVPIIELKPDTDVYEGRTLVVNYDYQKIYDMIKSYGLEKRCIVVSFDEIKLTNMRKVANIPVLLNSYDFISAELMTEKAYSRHGNSGISLSKATNITIDDIKSYHENGLMLTVWTATPSDKTEAIKYRDYGIDAVTADLIEDILQIN